MLSFALLTKRLISLAECSKLSVRVVLGSTLAFAALMAVVMRHTFDGTGLILLCSSLRFRVWFH